MVGSSSIVVRKEQGTSSSSALGLLLLQLPGLKQPTASLPIACTTIFFSVQLTQGRYTTCLGRAKWARPSGQLKACRCTAKQGSGRFTHGKA